MGVSRARCAVVGAAMGVAVLLLLKRAGALEQMQNRLEQ